MGQKEQELFENFRKQKTNKKTRAFQVQATYLQWHRIYVIYKKLINLQHEIYVTFANSGERKNCTTDFSIFLLENSWAETKTNWKQFKIEAAHLSDMKIWISKRRETPKRFSDECQWNHENIWSDRYSNPILPLEKFFSSTHCWDNLFKTKNRWQKVHWKEQKNELPEWINFLTF